MLPNTTLDHAQQLAAKLARNTMEVAHVVNDRGHFLVATDLDVACWHTDQIVFTVEPEQAFSAAELDGPMLMPEGDILDTDGMRVLPLLTDIAQVLGMALGHTSGGASIVAELQRVQERVQRAMERGCTVGAVD